MPYYAVGFGTTHGILTRSATEEEICEWKKENPEQEVPINLRIRTGLIDGSMAKTAGPFSTSREAWKAASDLQRGSSMMSPDPFVFKHGKGLNLKTLARKIDDDEYDIQKFYYGKKALHLIRFKKDYENKILGKWKPNVPSTIHGRRKFITRLRIDSQGY